MKTLKSKFFLSFLTLLFFTVTVILYGDPDGRTGRTLKTSSSGCGGCHGSSATADVSALITGPDTVNTGQTVQYSLKITKASKTGAGVDIAVRRGTLGVVSSNLHLASGELTQNNNIAMTSGTVTVLFNYIAPTTAGTDTIWATGLATNSDGGSSGDDWNWAPSKKIIVKNPTGISNISSAENFSLSQNYPNPFNPNTSIKLQLVNSMNIRLSIIDATGKELEILQIGNLKTGEHIINWNAENYSTGVYYYKVEGDKFTVTKKMLLIK